MISQQDKQFNALPSARALQNYIRYYNLVFPEKDTFAAQYTLMPNACGTLSLAFDGLSIQAELWGATTRPIALGAEPNGYRALLLIQLSPYGLYQLTRQEQTALADQRLPLADIDDLLCRQLRQVLIASKDARELAHACDSIFHRRLEKRVVSEALQSATAMIAERRGQVRVKEIARQVCYSERQLNRLFQAQIGMGVKQYARLTRFSYVLARLSKSPGLLAALSQQAGYFDQAHLDKDFKALSGVSPQEYLKTMADFYYDEAEIWHTISSEEE